MRRASLAAVFLFTAMTPPRAAAPSWHVTATVAESCSCTISCPCNFGGNPNRNPCEGNRIIAIESGHYEDVDLGGVTFLVTFTMRDWSKIYVSDTVSDKQMAAIEALLPIAFAGFHRGMLSFTKAPITMDITEKKVKFSGPESAVEMDVMAGFGGKPVKISNLPTPAYQDYTQYKSVSHTHSSEKAKWSHSGTNGFTSTMDVGSEEIKN
ncbi:MAG TPA: DUF1326 domain-containing protein [Vicinamibacterales bacterium]|nr:DUF1326 domain-containing protein [Vicinamibacterales bacterium]